MEKRGGAGEDEYLLCENADRPIQSITAKAIKTLNPVLHSFATILHCVLHAITDCAAHMRAHPTLRVYRAGVPAVLPTCVLFPQPVSPAITTAWFSCTARTIVSSYGAIGSRARSACSFLTRPTCGGKGGGGGGGKGGEGGKEGGVGRQVCPLHARREGTGRREGD